MSTKIHKIQNMELYGKVTTKNKSPIPIIIFKKKKSKKVLSRNSSHRGKEGGNDIFFTLEGLLF